MAKSLAEQLLGAGLVDEKKAKQLKHERKQVQKKKRQGAFVDETAERKVEISREKEAQAARDRELNKQRLEAERAKELQAQVRQMLTQSEQTCDGEIKFNFADPRSNKVKHLYVNAKVQSGLAKGQLSICALGEQYFVVPAHVADKVAERDPQSLIFRAAEEQRDTEDDPYKDFPIPDDLMW
ncbi:MAG: DUF2058 domain-containing protein [Idiomarina sp.]|nr:DUF2058 domain-containing protein [Idiomarina sp.]